MKKIVMIGNGSYSLTLKYYIESNTDWEIVGYADENKHYNDSFQGKPMISLEEMCVKFPPNTYEVIIGVGYLKMNENRQRIFTKIKNMGYSIVNFIHPTAILNNTQLGEGNVILENVVIEPNTIIKNNCIIWSSVLIGHNAVIENNNHLAACSLMAGNTYLEENCFLGNHSTIKDGIRIAHHTLIGAGAYVSKNTSPYSVIVPARSVQLEKYISTDFI